MEFTINIKNATLSIDPKEAQALSKLWEDKLLLQRAKAIVTSYQGANSSMFFKEGLEYNQEGKHWTRELIRSVVYAVHPISYTKETPDKLHCLNVGREDLNKRLIAKIERDLNATYGDSPHGKLSNAYWDMKARKKWKEEQFTSYFKKKEASLREP